jgi:hypothetical protein
MSDESLDRTINDMEHALGAMAHTGHDGIVGIFLVKAGSGFSAVAVPRQIYRGWLLGRHHYNGQTVDAAVATLLADDQSKAVAANIEPLRFEKITGHLEMDGAE